MSTAFKPADILLPKSDKASYEKWAVVACDQYTSEPEYWQQTAETVGEEPSTFKMILPEAYLETADTESFVHNINSNMSGYINDGLFDEYKNSYIYIERRLSDNTVRQGLIGKIDLEQYDYNKGSTSQVRATEATVLERIPPRVKIRCNAPLELPHIMILIDDEKQTVIEPFAAQKADLTKLYDFELMQGGGSISGYLVNGDDSAKIDDALSALADKEAFNCKYGLDGAEVLLFAMGDGNHSLATAKACYEQLKKDNPGVDMSQHPARYALVELVNLHSESLQFEAIHRIVTDVDTALLKASAEKELELSDELSDQYIVLVENGNLTKKYIHAPSSNLAVGSLQNFLDKFTLANGGKVDYIHGEDVVKALSEKAGSIGFILPDMSKSELFPTVIKDGALPRKTFSMGHAADKRYYIECRKIVE